MFFFLLIYYTWNYSLLYNLHEDARRCFGRETIESIKTYVSAASSLLTKAICPKFVKRFRRLKAIEPMQRFKYTWPTIPTGYGLIEAGASSSV